MIKILSFVLIFAIISPGCIPYRNYPLEQYEKKGSEYLVEFHMNDGTVYPVEKKEVAMIKSTKDSITIYYKNALPVILKKDQIASVKMRDMETFTTLVVLGSVVVVGLGIWATVIIIRGFVDIVEYVWSL
jgi:hypothetical protein